jgi:hypothetical protein
LFTFELNPSLNNACYPRNTIDSKASIFPTSFSECRIIES